MLPCAIDDDSVVDTLLFYFITDSTSGLEGGGRRKEGAYDAICSGMRRREGEEEEVDIEKEEEGDVYHSSFCIIRTAYTLLVMPF